MNKNNFDKQETTSTKTAGSRQVEFLVSKPFCEYGGMKFNQNTKSHICDDSGKVLCGVKSNWMEAGQPINTDGYIKGMEHLYSIYAEENHTCKKCLAKWLNLKTAC